jgi:hypothetical protein
VWIDHVPIDYPASWVLWDLGFVIIPRDMPRWGADVFLGAVVVFALVRILLLPFPDPQMTRLEVLTRFAWVWGTMWWLRACTVGLTRFPRLDPEAPLSDYDNILINMWGVAQADFMFSGHAQTMTMCGLFVSYYTFHHLYSQLMWLLVLAGYWAVLAARIHYSADVVVAITIATLMFFLFHLLVDPDCLSGWRSALVVSIPPTGDGTMTLPMTLTDGTGRKWEIRGQGSVQLGRYSSPARREAYRWIVGLLGGHYEHKNEVWT